MISLRGSGPDDASRSASDRIPPFLADEQSFERMLTLERRRCERTGERFALILLGLIHGWRNPPVRPPESES